MAVQRGRGITPWGWFAIAVLAILLLLVIIPAIVALFEPEPPAAAQAPRDPVIEAPRDAGQGGLGDVRVAQISDQPDQFIGRSVSVDGTIGEMIGANAFMLRGFETAPDPGGEILVVFGGEQAAVPDPEEMAQGRDVQVTGVVERFDRAAIEEQLGVTLDGVGIDARSGQPVILTQQISATAADQTEIQVSPVPPGTPAPGQVPAN
jgi:hypothetical protein